jgi:hypothetical protein
MNPGKLIDPIAVYDPTENLRIGAGYQAAKVKTWFQYPADNGSFSDATTRCVGVGACRKQDHGTMCPSYMATREEKHSTRGRAHLLWEMMQGNVSRTAGEISKSKRRSTSASPAKPARPSARQRRHGHLEGRVPRPLLRRALHPLHHYAFGFMDRWAKPGLHRAIAGQSADRDAGHQLA